MELYAIRYGMDFKYATNNTIFRNTDSTELASGFVFLYYIAKFENKVILFDTGFRDEKLAKDMGIIFIDVRKEVKKIIEDTDSVDIIFITHSHFDHIDNLDLYDKSSIVISKPEYDIALTKSPDAVKEILKSNRVTIVEDEYIYDNKFRFKMIGGHTSGSSVIYFEEGNRQYVITGDECYLCENIIKNIPNGNYVNGEKNEEFIADANQKGIIPLPFHDNLIITDYIPVSENIVKII